MCCYACAPSAQAMQWLWLRRGRGALCRLNAAAAGPGMVSWLVCCESARGVDHSYVFPGARVRSPWSIVMFAGMHMVPFWALRRR